MNAIPCDRQVNGEIPLMPGVRVPMNCCKFKGHEGKHLTKNTMNGIQFEIEYTNEEAI